MRKLKIGLPILLILSSTVIIADKNCCNNNSCAQAYITKYGNSCCGGCPTGAGNSKCKGCKNCACKVNSKSTFMVRPQFEVCSPEYLTAFRDRMDAREDGHGGSLQIVPFGGSSTRSDKLATYFTPYCKNTFVVKADSAEEPILNIATRDLDPQHFNVLLQDNPERYSQNITFCPKLNTAGLGLTYRQNLSICRDCYDPLAKHWYLEISSPLTWVQTTMGLSQCLTYTGETQAAKINDLSQTFYSNMVQAFNQPAWKYGKINGCCKCSKIGLADISLMIGYETLKCESATLDGFFGLLIPTGNKRCGIYVFEPMVGHGRHWGIMKGMHVKGTFFDCRNGEIVIEAAHDINGMYLFQADEIRSFDLKNKPWSRYMEVYQNQAQAQQAFDLSGNVYASRLLSSPGINTFTQCLQVRPGLSVNTNTALILSGKKFRGEIGYNLYWRQAECVDICCWKEGAAIKAVSGQGNTEPLRTISQPNEYFTDYASPEPYPTARISDPIAKYAESIIKECDLDMESASHPAYLANTVYMSLGARYDDREVPLFFDLGGSYEFEQENITLNRWTLWAKGGVSF